MNKSLCAKDWPICRKNQIHVNNPEHWLAILTCWTKKELVIEKLKEKGIEYNSIGQLYTERGYSPLIRNLLSNRNIIVVFIFGRDLSGAGRKLVDILELIKSSAGTVLDIIKKEVIEKVDLKGISDISSKKVFDLLSRILVVYIDKVQDLNDNIDSLIHYKKTIETEGSFERIKVYNIAEDVIICPEPKPETIEFPSNEFGHVVTGRTIPETYLKMLQYILRFGKITGTHYDDPQKEVLAMQNIITNEDNVWDLQRDKIMSDKVIPEWMPESKEHLSTYIRDRILSGKHYEDLKYTYGELIFAFPSDIHVTENQFNQALSKMAEDENQRSCVISLWNPRKHSNQKSGTPCINHIQFRLRNGKLTMHVLIRSNDMYAGWPENAYALRALQELFAYELHQKEIDCKIGPLCITSISAHLYQDTWEPAQELVNKYLWKVAEKPWREWDRKGQFEVELEVDKIKVTLVNKKNTLQIFSDKTAREICNRIAREVVTDNISNVMYLARELQKAEIALRTR